MRLPPLNALRAFEAASRLLSFQKAAEELYVTPSALSYQIKSLEEHLGVSLFERGNRQVTLTEAGDKIRPDIAEAFQLMQRGVDRLAAGTPDNVVVVSCGPSHAAKWLAPRLYRFAEKHPDLELRISASLSLTDFEQEGVDVALRFGPGYYPGLHVEKMFDEHLTPMIAPHLLASNHPINQPDDLRHYQLLHDDSFKMIGHNVGWVDWLKAAGNSSIDGTKGLRFTHADHCIEAAVNGAGVALARVALGTGDLKNGRLIAPFDLQIPTSYATSFVCPLAYIEREKVRRFRDWLFAELGCLNEG